MENCIYCGKPLTDGKCEENHSFKKMCINCAFSKENEDGSFTCVNKDNLEATREKMLEAIKNVSEAYSVKDFCIEPLPLKKPLLKCSKWELHPAVLTDIANLFM